MKLKEMQKEAIKILEKNEINDANFIAEVLIEYALDEDRQYIIVNDDNEVDDFSYNRFFDYINQIVNGTPLQYITNKKEFMDYNFYVDDRVLIPQPDTEIVVQKSIEICKEKLEHKDKIKVLDLCTGSGVIAISLDKQLKDKNIEIYASDISRPALEVAFINKRAFASRVEFIKSNMFENINDKFDLIISNPPYIEKDVIKTLSKDVQEEPIIALDGGIDGLDFYRIIEKESRNFLEEDGNLCLEIGYNQAEKIKDLFKNYSEVQIIKDYGQNDRCAFISL